jgi:putative ABC transport system permease protein
VNGEVSTIVGIMPEGFGFPYWQDVWIPLRIDHLSLARGEGPGLDVFGRLRSGVSLEQARAEFVGISDRLAQAYPETNENLQPLIEGYTRSYLGPESTPGFVAMALTVLGVLLIACFNVANLLLALAVTRIRDLAIRVAVGASRRRVIVKVLHEALLMAAIGAVLGTGLALVGVEIIDRYIVATATFPPPFWMIFKVDAPILLFVVGITGICAMASGVLPALKASKADVNSLLQENSRAGTSIRMGRMSRLMVMAEITVSATLLVVSGHLAWDVVRTQDAHYLYPVDDVLTARVGLFEEMVPTQEARLGFFENLQGRLEQQPSVVSVYMATVLPGSEVGRYGFTIQGEEMEEGPNLPRARAVRVSPGFFQALDVPVAQGREFTWEDNLDAERIALVNQSFSERFFPETSPLGRQVRFGGTDSDSPWLTVVGVVPDLNMDGTVDPKGNPEGIYLPIAQGDVTFVSVAIRTRGDPLAFAPTLRDEVAALQGDTPIFYVQTLRDAINNNLLDFILLGGLFAAFAVAAFFMAAVGLYSVTAFLASQRTRELGLRMALGAGAGSILGLVLRKGVYQVAFGIALGVVFAAIGRLMMESGGGWVTEWNMTIAVLVSITLGITGLLAVVTPALRATRVNPVDALRME